MEIKQARGRGWTIISTVTRTERDEGRANLD